MLQPLADNVIVEPTRTVEELLESGIVLPALKSISPTQAAIVAVGPDVIADIKVGQKVVFMKFQGETVSYDGKKYIIMNQKAILMLLPED